MMLTCCATARASGRSHRLLKFKHELIDRLAARRLDREVARILEMAPENRLRRRLNPAASTSRRSG
jgi:hypothetical protein